MGYSPWGLQKVGQARMVVQWLGLCVFTAQGPGQGTKCSKKKKKKINTFSKSHSQLEVMKKSTLS